MALAFARIKALTRDLEGRCPKAWLRAIRVRSLDFSDSVYDNMQPALAWIRRWAEEGAAPCTKSD